MRRPWNIIDCPVYSLATYREGQVNMNICTYVTAVSMQPKLYAVAIDPATKTYENLVHSERAVLQLLHRQQLSLIRTLGKKSGKQYDKQAYLEKKEALKDWRSFSVLKAASAYLLLEKMSEQVTGDHVLFLFRMQHYRTQSEDGVLLFQDLIEEGLIL